MEQKISDNRDRSIKKPLCFQKNGSQEHCFDYWNNKKVWILSGVFFLRLNRFDSYIESTRSRKFILILDNCSAHGNKIDAPQLKNSEVVFLAPYSTSKLQPRGV